MVQIPILQHLAGGQTSHIKSAWPWFHESTVEVAWLAVNTLLDLASLVDTTTVRVGPSNQCIRVEGTTERPRLPTYLPTYPPPSTYLPTYNHLVSRLAKQPAVAAGSSSSSSSSTSTSSRQAGRQLATPATSSTSTYSISSCWFSPFAFSAVLHDLSSPRPPSPSLSLLLCARARAPVDLLHIVVVEITTTIQDYLPIYLPYRYHHGTVHTVHSGTIPESHRGHSSCIADNVDPPACTHIHARTYMCTYAHVPDVHTKSRAADARTRLRTHTPVYTRTERCIRAYACVHKSTTAA